MSMRCLGRSRGGGGSRALEWGGSWGKIKCLGVEVPWKRQPLEKKPGSWDRFGSASGKNSGSWKSSAFENSAPFEKHRLGIFKLKRLSAFSYSDDGS